MFFHIYYFAHAIKFVFSLHLSAMKNFGSRMLLFVGCALSIVLLSNASCEHVTNTDTGNSSTKGSLPQMNVAFYNLENLFDIEDDPLKNDEDFTPGGKLKWDNERYKLKLSQLSDVIDALPGDLPAFIGMCEVENRKVLEDLRNQSKVSGKHYAIIHKDSPDERGIDVAAFYDSSKVSVEYFNYTTINLPVPKNIHTRDILYVKLKANHEFIHLFVNHWPSRRGGQAKSEPNRIAVANVLESLITKIEKSDKNAKILIMGDFNDYPTDKSIATVLGAGVTKESRLFNYMYDDHKAGQGSYYYKNEWGALDQFIGSKFLLNARNGWSASESSAYIFRDDLIMFKDKEGVQRPNRTFLGEDYKGGYSDHLAIYMTLTWK